ncbi:hypothetical protein E8E13_004294 [Curvularia kusanoi]|uniref:Uncharacterized protein n=1 Tax=Curvularia kusanoi TaxID=90978 RepID=A0A9P4T9K8_CURKU|nr:hypothetical protein E8E13_004294 [Curvularia kusanoi]
MTTAQAVPALEVSAPDDNMDVLSDTGFDFGDGDIDLELDTAPSINDDDMSINDAGTDGGIDMQELPLDQDDFMADHGDFTEEDQMYNVGETAGGFQTVNESSIAFEADMLAPPDEDLIDYSDDEAQQQIKMHSPSVHDEQLQALGDTEITSVSIDNSNEDGQTQDGEQPLEVVQVSNDQVSTHGDGTENQVEPEADTEQRLADVDAQHDDVGDDHSHADDGGVALPTDEHAPYGDDTVAEKQNETQQDIDDHSDSNESHASEIELRPVTVNYAGNELWLFKQHDLDESGDFLLEDLAVAKSSISHVFQACRLSLGDDVSGEHEIGLRFDSLHNLELYEDNTACVAVSLERLVDLYHTLQSQDGNEDPECFYVTLQFRPRFATLLADVAQYAEQGSGYSVFNAAVAAGETHFSNVFSGSPTEHEYAEWDDEEEVDDEEASSPGVDRDVTPDAHNADEHGNHPEAEEQETKEHDQNEEEDGDGNDIHEHEGVALADVSSQTLGTRDEESRGLEATANLDISESAGPGPSGDQVEAVSAPRLDAVAEHLTDTQDERTPDQIAHDKQEAEDFVDYSDDEDEEVSKSGAGRTTSPSSATVQGDEPTEIEETGTISDVGGHVDENGANAGFDEDDETTLLTQTQYGDDADHYAFQDYAGTYDQDDSFQEYQADGTVGSPIEANDAHTGNTNSDSAEYNFRDTDGEAFAEFGDQPVDDDYEEATLEAIEEVSHAEALLDLENAPEWAVDADPAPDLPGEDAVLLHDNTTAGETDQDGAAEQDVEANLAADPAAFNNHGLLSPQGRKRSLDEVDDGVDDAPDSTGMAPRLLCNRPPVAYYSLPEAKRPRV